MPQAILIVGGGLGIGFEITKAILQDTRRLSKPSVVVFGLHADERLKDLEEEYKGRIWTVIGDVTSELDRVKAIQVCVGQLGGIDTLVYAAGVITPIERIEHLDIDDVKRAYDVNVFGAMAMVCCCLAFTSPHGTQRD